MSWARLDDAILDNPKIIAAGPLGFALHVAAITWCARNLTDGLIPKRRVAQLLDLPSLQVTETTKIRVLHTVTPDDLAADLVQIGLWHDRGETWELHDFLRYNFSRAQVLSRRARTAERVRKFRHKTGNAVTNAVVTRLPGPGSGSFGSGELSFPSETQGAVPRPSRFADFWQSYPKKRHRPAAERAWKRLEADRIVEAIVAGVARWQTSEQWLEGRIEDPATFLNQRQWEDPVPRATTEARPSVPGRLVPGVEATRALLKRMVEP